MHTFYSSANSYILHNGVLFYKRLLQWTVPTNLNGICSAAPNAHHMSTTAITSIRESFGKATTQQAIHVIDYAVPADECTDISGREMLSICGFAS